MSDNRNGKEKVQEADAVKLFRKLGNVLYLIIGLVLIALALFAIWIAVSGSFLSILNGESHTSALLTSVGLVVLGLAVFDVGKYLIEEEILRNRELRETSEVRHSLTKFLTILIIALGLEALVYVFRVGKPSDAGGASDTGLEQLIHPTLLILAVAVLIFALGWYQKLSIRAEVSEKTTLSMAEKGKVPLPEGKEHKDHGIMGS